MIGAYINKDKNDGEGRPDEMEGNSVGPFVVPVGAKEDYNGSKVTDVGTSDATITPGWIFDHLGVINTGNTTLIFCIDKSTTDTPNTKLIYLPPGAPYNMALHGNVLHYKSDSAGGEFIYVLGKAVKQ